MAQAIHCDTTDHADVLADVMVSQTANGDTSAWCFPCYVEVCRQVVETVEATVREATAAEAEARLAGVTPPDGSDQEPDGSSDTPGPGQVSGPPDLGVSSFHPEGDQPVQEGLGGPETGDPGQPPSEPAPAGSAAPGALTDAPG